jgi:hypothetical protein
MVRRVMKVIQLLVVRLMRLLGIVIVKTQITLRLLGAISVETLMILIIA